MAVPNYSNDWKGIISVCIYCGTDQYRKIYENHHGKIPVDEAGRTYDVHHIDGDRSNNDPTNLVALSIQDHYNIHYSQGDWMACHRLGAKMKISAEELANINRTHQRNLVQQGIHPLQRRADGTSIQTDLVSRGEHHWQDSELATARNKKRVQNGTHNFQGGEISGITSRRRVKEGTHNLSTRSDGSSLSSDRVKSGSHNLLRREDGSSVSSDNVKNGKNPIGKLAAHQLKNGTHPSQKKWKCEHCGTEGNGSTNYNRWHGDKCKHKETINSLL